MTQSVTPTKPPLSIAISQLQKQTYAHSKITTAKTITPNGNYTSAIISYVVDGLTEYALLAIPTFPKPTSGYPVVIIDHGYIVPSQYSTTGSYAGEVNFFASNEYIVIKPDYRGNGSSQGAEDPLQRYKYPVDVMTLLASLKSISQADTSRVYLWGHSMGGEVTLEVLEILGAQMHFPITIKAAALWAPVTDPAQWFSKQHVDKIPEAQLTPFPYTKTFQLLGEPSDASPIWQSINPLNFLSSIFIPIQLSHGTGDTTVPYSWSIDLENKLKAQGKRIDFISYPGADHNLSPSTFQALQNTLQFFNSHQ